MSKKFMCSECGEFHMYCACDNNPLDKNSIPQAKIKAVCNEALSVYGVGSMQWNIVNRIKNKLLSD